MGGIVDYVRNETRTFDELPFTEVDALVFAQLSYASVPDDMSRLRDLLDRYGTLGRRLRAFDPRHPLVSLRMLRHAPFPSMTVAEAGRLVRRDEASLGGKASAEDDGDVDGRGDGAGGIHGVRGDDAGSGGAAADGASADGAAEDGAAEDGGASDGAAAGGTVADGAAVDGAVTDGAVADGTVADGAVAADGDGASAPQGPAADGPSGKGTGVAKGGEPSTAHGGTDGRRAARTDGSDVGGDETEGFHMLHLADPAAIRAFRSAVADSPRFSSVRVGAFSTEFDRELQTQFAAVTYLLPDADGTMVVAFRGTDDSLVGWKEDFNMAFQYPVPSQRSASAYLQGVASLWDGPYVLTGHSKGGNLGVYAAMNAPASVRTRIRRIYSLDGPGFPGWVVRSAPYAAVTDRVTKIVPDSSIVGMILETPERCEVVRSDAEGIMQHFAFTWQVEGDSFVRCRDMAPSSQTFNQELNAWLSTLTTEQREHAVDALFAVLDASGATSFRGLLRSMPMALPGMIGAIAGLTPDERRHIGTALRILVRAATARNRDHGGTGLEGGRS